MSKQPLHVLYRELTVLKEQRAEQKANFMSVKSHPCWLALVYHCKVLGRIKIYSEILQHIADESARGANWTELFQRAYVEYPVISYVHKIYPYLNNCHSGLQISHALERKLYELTNLVNRIVGEGETRDYYQRYSNLGLEILEKRHEINYHYNFDERNEILGFF